MQYYVHDECVHFNLTRVTFKLNMSYLRKTILYQLEILCLKCYLPICNTVTIIS